MTDMTRADVLVVGAGVHGAAAARGLAERGARVVLLDLGSPGDGPTGRSSGICRSYYTDPFLHECARDSVVELESGSLAGRSGFRRTGGVYLHGPEDAAAVHDLVAALRASGAGLDVVEPAGLAHVLAAGGELFGELDLNDVAVAVHEPAAGYADPYATTGALVEQAVSLGTVVRPWTRVVTVEPAGPGHPAAVVTADGTVLQAERVLVAAGPWTAPLLATAGVHLPLTVERHVVVATSGPADTRAEIFLADVPGGYYLRPETGLSGLLGGLEPSAPADPDDVDTAVHDSDALPLVARAVGRLPRLAAATIPLSRGWASVYDVSPDWQPVIGEVEAGLYVDAGTSGHGFKLAPALGRHVAGLVLGDAPDALSRFSPERFSCGELLGAGFGNRRIIG